MIVFIFLGIFATIAFTQYLQHRETMMLAEKGILKPRRSSGNGTLFWGLAFTFVGFALLVGLYPLGWVMHSGFPLHFGPWLLAGLIPMAFGLALLLAYQITRREEAAEANAARAPLELPRPEPPAIAAPESKEPYTADQS